MKKILIIVLLAFGMNVMAQITFEHYYDSASTITVPHNQLMIINFEVSGEHYVNINRIGKYISIYDMNHNLLKTIDCFNLPTPGNYLGYILYISEQLFDSDNKIEFLYGYAYSDENGYFTGIYNEDGTSLFSDTGATIVNVNVLQQQYPIYNTSYGAKMILSYPNGGAKVFSLPGTLSTDIEKANEQLVALQTGQGSLGNLYPNPNSGLVTLDYKLPDGEHIGELVLYNMQGTEVKRYKVDDTFNAVLLDNSQLPAGTYFYQLQTSKGAVGTKKMMVIK